MGNKHNNQTTIVGIGRKVIIMKKIELSMFVTTVYSGHLKMFNHNFLTAKNTELKNAYLQKININ